MAETAGIIIFFLWYIGIAINYATENNNVKGDEQTEIRKQGDNPKQAESPKQLSYHSQKTGASGTKSSRGDNKSDLNNDTPPITATVKATKDHIMNASETLIEVLHDISKLETNHEFQEIKSNMHSYRKENNTEEEHVRQVQDIMQDFIHKQEPEIFVQELELIQQKLELAITPQATETIPQELNVIAQEPEIIPQESAMEEVLDGTFSDTISTASERNHEED